MRIVFAGDWHASAEAAWATIEKSAEIGADAVIQVGDFMFTGAHKHKFLSSLERATRRHGIPVYFIRGNHDDTAFLKKVVSRHDFSASPFVPISDNVFYIPDGTVWEWDGVRLGGLGGAFSVDHAMRTEGKDWWADEITAWSDAQRIMHAGQLDILITHDVPDTVAIRAHRGGITPAEWDIIGAAPNQRTIALAVDATAPEYHIAGHMHTRQTEFIATTSGAIVRSIILDRGDYIGRERTRDVLSQSLLVLDINNSQIAPYFDS